jgi:uncharacterized cupin superfamily protein
MTAASIKPISLATLDWVTPPHPYPPGFDGLSDGKEVKNLSSPLGLRNFVVALVRLAPGAQDALRHWHSKQDEFVYMLDGELTLVTDARETTVSRGQSLGFRFGVEDGHMLENRSDLPATFMVVVGSRKDEVVTFSDHDLVLDDKTSGPIWQHRNGVPYG